MGALLEPTAPIVEPITTTDEETDTTAEEETTTELIDITTFAATGDELCTENGKPLVQLFSTTTCPQCVWIKDTFDDVVTEYAEAGKITAYHWDLDIGDNALTTETESSVPNSQVQIFQKYNPQGYVPVFVIGCKYTRIDNGYESQGNLAAEEAELLFFYFLFFLILKSQIKIEGFFIFPQILASSIQSITK